LGEIGVKGAVDAKLVYENSITVI
jgi:hypothetical protein